MPCLNGMLFVFYVGISDTPPPQDDESPEEGEGGQDEADADAAAAEEVSDAHMDYRYDGRTIPSSSGIQLLVAHVSQFNC